MPYTPSHASGHLCLIWKESIQNYRSLKADAECRTDGQMEGRSDGQTDRVKPIYPLKNFVVRQVLLTVSNSLKNSKAETHKSVFRFTNVMTFTEIYEVTQLPTNVIYKGPENFYHCHHALAPGNVSSAFTLLIGNIQNYLKVFWLFIKLNQFLLRLEIFWPCVCWYNISCCC